MALLKWTDGDTITERSANNKGIRKGTEAEIAAIASVDNEIGDVTYNTTTGMLNVQTGGGASDDRANIPFGYEADSNEVTVTGLTATQVKNSSFIINTNGLKGNQLTVVAEIKTSNVGTTAHFRVRLDGSGSDSLDLTTTSATYEIKTGTINLTGLSAGRHTIEIFMDDGSGDTITNRELELIFT